MKFKTTAKAIREGYYDPICVGYCGIQHLLYFEDAVAYTCGVYGWNFDLYVVEGKAITTGYRGLVGRRANNAGEYDKKAQHILYGEEYRKTPYEEKRAMVKALLHEFIEQA